MFSVRLVFGLGPHGQEGGGGDDGGSPKKGRRKTGPGQIEAAEPSTQASTITQASATEAIPMVIDLTEPASPGQNSGESAPSRRPFIDRTPTLVPSRRRTIEYNSTVFYVHLSSAKRPRGERPAYQPRCHRLISSAAVMATTAVDIPPVASPHTASSSSSREKRPGELPTFYELNSPEE